MSHASPPDDPDDYEDPDDGVELELEPVDPAVLAADRSRAARKVEQVLGSVDLDEMVRNPYEGEGLGVDWQGWKSIRFTTRHLLILTAILAVAMSIGRSAGGVMLAFIAAVVGCGGGWFWVYREERRLAAAKEMRKEQLRAAGFGANRPPSAPVIDDVRNAVKLNPYANFKFQYSLRQLLGAMTVSAVVMGVLRLIGPGALSLGLGVIAILGLVIYAAGFEAPAIFILGWWVLLALYLFFGFVAALLPAKAALRHNAPTASITRRC